MADKKLTFELAGRGWADQQKQLGLLLKSLDNLKKSGHDVSKVFKGLDLSTGLVKFNKELQTSVKSMRGLGKEVQDYLKVFSDQRVKSSQDYLTQRLKEQEVYIKMYAKDLRDVNISTEKRLELETKLQTALTKRQVFKGQLTPQLGGIARGIGATAEGLGITLPEGMLAGASATIGTIGAIGAAGMVIDRLVSGVAGKFAASFSAQLQGQIAAAQLPTRMVSAGWRGQLGEETYKAGIGVYGEAGAYQKKALGPELLHQGYWATAMGARNRREALGMAMFNPGLWGHWLATGGKELWTGPEAARNIIGPQVWQEGMQAAEARHAPSIEAYRHMTERAESYFQMRRLLGSRLYGRTETGRLGVIGGAMTQGYTFDEASRAALDLTERGGARAAGGGTIADVVKFQRQYGIERAGGILGGLGAAGGFGRGTGGPAATEALANVLSVAVSKGLNQAEMKLELESFVEASTTAAERMMSRYGGFGDIRGTTAQTAYSMAAMMPAGATTIDTQRVAAAYESRNAVLSGQTSPYIRARTMASMMPVMANAMGTSPLSFAAMRMAIDMPMESITADNPQIRGFATLSGVSPQAMADKILAARTSGARSAMDFLRPGQRRHLEETSAAIRAWSAAAAAGKPTAEMREQFRGAMGEMSVVGTLMGAPGDEYTRGMAATGVFNVAGKTWVPTEAEQAAMKKMMPTAFQPQDATALAQRKATSEGELAIMKQVDSQVLSIRAAIEKGGEAAGKLSENFGKLGDAARLTKDFATNLDFLVKVLDRGNKQFGQLLNPGGGRAQVGQ